MILFLPPQAPDTSALVTTLKEAKLTFTEVGNFYSLLYTNTNTKRKQTVYIRKVAESYNTITLREAFSFCYDAKDAPSDEVLTAIFQKRFGIGGLVLEAPSQAQPNWRIRFRLDLATTLTAPQLAERLQLIQATADTLEKELYPMEEDRL